MTVDFLITGGGTGGHVYPALSIIRSLRRDGIGAGSNPVSSNRSPETSGVTYVGNSRGMERSLVPQAGIPSSFFPMAPPSRVQGPPLLLLSTLRSILLMLRERPRATLATGGYVSVPAAVASWLCRVPLVLFLPDVVPGVAVRRLVPIARCIAVTSEDSLRYLPRDKTVVTGYPVRESFLRATRESGRQLLGIPAEATVLCVFGGSLGAQSINRAVARYLPDLLRRHYVLHICGWQRLEEAQAAAVGLTELQRARYRLYPFLDEEHMAAAMASADLALCRSGASTLGELPAVGTPAVLVPLPQREVHQLENASYLADRGAAVVLANDELHDRLGEVLLSLLDDPDRLLRMAEACASLARPQAADDVAALLLELAA